MTGGDKPLLVVLRALKLGDFLTAIPALRGLRQAFPHHHHVLAAPAGIGPLVYHTGVVDELLPTAELAPVAVHKPDIAVDLHGKGPMSQPLLLATRPNRLIAFEHPAVFATRGMPRWRRGEHEVLRWCRLLQESGIDADPKRLDVAAPALPVPEFALGATIVHPGAGSAARRWPPERFAAIAAREREEGREVVVTGGNCELGLTTAMAEMAGIDPTRVLAGRTSLLDLVALVASANMVVCGDTGVAHVATAVGTPSVVLFGPVAPSEWGPPRNHPRHRALWAGRNGDPHGRSVDPGLLSIDVDDVLGAMATARIQAASETR